MSATIIPPSSRFDQILKDLRMRLRRAEFGPGERLPAERELAAQYHCSQPTINKVIATLVSDGMLKRKETRGAFVPEQPASAVVSPKTIRFMGWLAAEALGADMWNAVASSFQALRPELQIESNAVAFDQFPQRLTQLIGQGRAPDVVQLVNNWTPRFAAMDALLPLDDLLPAEITRDHVSWRKSVNTYRGAAYSVDWALTSSLFFYNTTVMKEAGLDPQRPPRTMVELREMAAHIDGKQLRRDGQPVHGFGLPTDAGEVTATYWLPVLYSFAESMLNGAGRVALDAPESVRALEFYRDMAVSSKLPPGQSIWEVRRLFAQHRVAFMLDGAMGRGFFRKESGEGVAFDAHFGAAPMPLGPTGLNGALCHHHSLAISTQSEQQEEGLAFVGHLLSDRDLAKKYFDEEGLIPARRSLLELPEYQEPYAKLVLSETLKAKSLPAGFPQLQMASVFLGDAILRAVTGEISAGEAMAKAARDVNLLFSGN